MSRIISDPVSELYNEVRSITARFAFERSMSFVGRSDFNDNALPDQSKDVDIHDGTIVTTHGYFRLARHKESGTICLIASKASANLQGIRQDDGRTIEPTRIGLQKSYIVSAYRTSGDNDDVYKVVPQLRRSLRRFGEDLGERSDKHFTLYGASVSNADGKSQDFNANTPTEVYTNGRLAYVIDKTSKGYKVQFYAPTRREGGGFVPITMGEKSLRDKFASVSKVIALSPTYAVARQKMAEHWQIMSSKLWDEKNIFEGEGIRLNAEKKAASIYNYLYDNGSQLAAVTSTIGLGMGLVNPKYGLASGLLAAIIHTALHSALDEGFAGTREAVERAKQAKQRLDISAYNFVDDVSDHFKEQTSENILKLCAKIDMDRFEADEFEFLDAETSGMLLDHQHTTDGFRPSSLSAHLLSAHQRGFSSTCTLPDDKTRLDVFQSGLTRFMHEQSNGKIVLYCRYRPDITIAENLRLPEDKRNKIGDDIIRLDYDRRRDSFQHAFKQFPRPVSIDEMMEQVEDLLFGSSEDVDQTVKNRSLKSVRETFDLPEQDACSRSFMSRKPAVPPELSAILR